MKVDGKSRYHEVHARSLADPDGFWAEAAKEIDWICLLYTSDAADE